MATVKRILCDFVANWFIFICLLMNLINSEDVGYSIHDSRSEINTVISFESHHNLYKRQASSVGQPSSTSAATSSAKPTTKTFTQTQTTKSSTKQTTVKKATTAQTTTPQYTERPDAEFHKYYTSRVITSSGNYWLELVDTKASEPLSGSHRVAVSVPINFKFKFYGHEVQKITVATGGFLYMSPFLHQWLTATQYIAPLMANFDTTIGNDSQVVYRDFGSKFVVEWRNVYLQDQNHTHPFSFQTILHVNGTILFVYKKVPLEVLSIDNKNHPVKIGVSDAFYIDSIVGGQRRRTIYEYHRVEVNVTLIKEDTVVILEPLTTCNVAKDCDTCLTQDDSFNCKWCAKLKRCSDGIDWQRQQWLDQGCVIMGTNELNQCPKTTTIQPTTVSKLSTTLKQTLSTAKITTTQKPQTTQKSTTTSRIPTIKITTTQKPRTTQKSTTTTRMPTTKITTTQKPTSTSPTPTTTTTLKTTLKSTTTTQTTHKSTSTQTSMTSPASTVTTENVICSMSAKGNCTYQPGVSSGRNDKDSGGGGAVAAVVVVIILLLALVCGIGGWFYYAYTHPTSASGQWMIQHRPSEMKAKMSKMKFWKRNTASGEKYAVETEA